MDCSALVIRTGVLVFTAPGLMAPVFAHAVVSDSLIQARKSCLASVAKTVGLPSSRLKVIKEASDALAISIDIEAPSSSTYWGCLTVRQGKLKVDAINSSEGML